MDFAVGGRNIGKPQNLWLVLFMAEMLQEMPNFVNLGSKFFNPQICMSDTTHSFYLSCWSCGRQNIPYVFKTGENAPSGTTTVQVPCPFCQKMMSVDIPFALPNDTAAIKNLPTKKG